VLDKPLTTVPAAPPPATTQKGNPAIPLETPKNAAPATTAPSNNKPAEAAPVPATPAPKGTQPKP